MYYAVVVVIVKRYYDCAIDKEVVRAIEDHRGEKGSVQKEDTGCAKNADSREGIFRIHLQYKSKVESIILLRKQMQNNSTYAQEKVLDMQLRNRGVTRNAGRGIE